MVRMFIVPLSVGHGLHEMRIKLVAVTRLFLLQINTTFLKETLFTLKRMYSFIHIYSKL